MSGTTLKRMSAETEELKTIKETLSDLKRMVDAQSLTERASKMIHLSIPKITIQRKPKSPTKENEEVQTEHHDTISTGICIQLTPPSPDKRRKVDIGGTMLDSMFSFRNSKVNEVKREDHQATIKMEIEDEPKLFQESSTVSEVNTMKDSVDSEALRSNPLAHPVESRAIPPSNPDIPQKQSMEAVDTSALNATIDANLEKEACASVPDECKEAKQAVEEKIELENINKVDCPQDENKQQSIGGSNGNVISAESDQTESSEKVPQCEETAPNNELNSFQPDQVIGSAGCDQILPEQPLDNLPSKMEETKEDSVVNEAKEINGSTVIIETIEANETKETTETKEIAEITESNETNETTETRNKANETNESSESNESVESNETAVTSETKEIKEIAETAETAETNESKETAETTETFETNGTTDTVDQTIETSDKANETNESNETNIENKATEVTETVEMNEANETTETKIECEGEQGISIEPQSLTRENNSQSNQSNEESDKSVSNITLNALETTKSEFMECEPCATSVNSSSEIEITVTSNPKLNEPSSTTDNSSSTVNVTDSVHLEISQVFSQSPLKIEEENKPDMEIEEAEKDNVNSEKEETAKKEDESAMEIEEGHTDSSSSIESNKMEEENRIEVEERDQQDDVNNNPMEKPSEIESINEVKSSDKIQSDTVHDSTCYLEPKQIDESVVESGVIDKKEVKCSDGEPISASPTVVLSAKDATKSPTKEILEPQREDEKTVDLKPEIDSPVQTKSNESTEIKETIDSSIQNEQNESSDDITTIDSSIQSESKGPNHSLSIESTEIKATTESPIPSELIDSHPRNSQVSNQTALTSSPQSSPDDCLPPMPTSPPANQQSITHFFPVTKNHSPISHRTTQKDHAPISQPIALNSSSADSPICSHPSPLPRSSSTSNKNDHLQSASPLPSNQSPSEPSSSPDAINSIPLSSPTQSKPSNSFPSAPFKPPRSIEPSSSHPPPPSLNPPSPIPPQLTSVKNLPLSLESKMNSILNQLDSQLSSCHQPYRPVSRQPTPPPLPPPSLPISRLVFVYISNRGCAVGLVPHSNLQDRIRLLISYILHTPSLLRHHPVLTSSMLPVPEFLSYMKEKQLPSIVIPILEIVVDGSSLLLLNDESIFKSVCFVRLTLAFY